MSTEEWRRVMSVNLDGAFFTLRAAARHMTERGDGGSLVVTASLAAISGAARGEHYAATKGALISMMKSLAVELAALQGARQRHPARLDRHADDREGAPRRGLQRQGAAPRAHAALGRGRRTSAASPFTSRATPARTTAATRSSSTALPDLLAASQLFFGSPPSTGSPASAQPLKPGSRCATSGKPISRSTSAASAERCPPAQCSTMRFSGSTLPE